MFFFRGTLANRETIVQYISRRKLILAASLVNSCYHPTKAKKRQGFCFSYELRPLRPALQRTFPHYTLTLLALHSQNT